MKDQKLQARLRRLHRRLPSRSGLQLDLSFIDPVAGRDVEDIAVERAVVHATVFISRTREDKLDAARLIEDLKPSLGADEEVPTRGCALAIKCGSFRARR